ncbi:NAD(P)-dependent oxidoreductase [Prauserella marina]|uniref:NAD(P)-dependent dehydrogenase, short-chain alcohol dehydrogenase family n=1 Tax=Prauserella marina TaxID=530584 RepID=A0A222VP86_9PSEU|nr:SDR family oxidoreductase [Prauserella marina]ASR35531.1 NAD(P)-dependent oxidoreductase [Prauserella marina]PWV84630.1 NAD(P)-dependent dehydrogenase (short-subunit alcohol dehydrogenase family) [Prauserella marina]SDC17232.1 NAD(P)-dependent dehydrogenase, short-chain alcohol dehydrogenase family [Prauserella marina]
MAERKQPPQQQDPPGLTSKMDPLPRDSMSDYEGRDLLTGRRALITGGDSGIGRAVAVAFAKEGADVAIAYLSEHEDAEETAALVRAEGRECVLLPGDLAEASQCEHVVARAVGTLGGLDILVNNVATQWPVDSPEDLTEQQWMRTFDVNMHSYFRVTAAALPHLSDGDVIINTGSVNGLRGNKSLIDYSATKGAIHAWTYSMAQALAKRRIRVNCVAPGPVWTPLIPSTFPPEKVEKFGLQVPFEEAAQPDDLAPSYVFLASNRLSGYYSGEVIAALGGETTPG